MKKTIIIIASVLGSILLLIFVLITIVTIFINKNESNYEKKVLGKTHITDIAVLKEEKRFDDHELLKELVACDCYLVIDGANMFHGIEHSYMTGKLIVTEKYYNVLKNKYSDWCLESGLPNISDFTHADFDVEEKADECFLSFVKNNSYLSSKECYNETKCVYLLSQDEPVIFFYQDRW